MSTESLPEHVQKNRQAWDNYAVDYVAAGERSWATNEPDWGIFSIPEHHVQILPTDLAGKDTIELGCGTAYVSAWLARRGARPVGIDNSPNQLATARRLQAEHELDFPLHLGNAEATPFSDESFDLAISEYGASIWCDPYRWIPEAARLLRPGGLLIFLVNGLFVTLCTPLDADDDTPVTERLERPLFGLHRVDWADGSAEFHISHGEWISLLRANQFEILELKELRPMEDATTTHSWMPLSWARKWPCEEVWTARKQYVKPGDA